MLPWKKTEFFSLHKIIELVYTTLCLLIDGLLNFLGIDAFTGREGEVLRGCH